MLFLRTVLVSLLLLGVSVAHAEPRILLQLVDYVGVDYPEAVQGGEVVNPGEYEEMHEFGARIGEEIAALDTTDDVRNALTGLAAQLRQQVNDKAEPSAVAATTQQIRNLVMASFELDLAPRMAPDLAEGAALYQQQCVACHGASGQGDGPLAGTMEPAPTDFHEVGRARERSVFGLYNTITLGVDGTGMGSYNQLSDDQRWALAFYVGSLFGEPATQDQWQANPLTLEQAVTRAPAELDLANADALMLYARNNPGALFAAAEAPLDVAREGIALSARLYQQGDIAAARKEAITAYLEGFELVEAALNNVSPQMMRAVETSMMDYRALLDGKTDADVVNVAAQQLIAQLDDAQAALEGDTLSPQVAFTSSLVILLREGLEAILVLAAMAAFLIKTERRDALRWLHAGWVLALVAGAGTWAVSNWVFTISGATREITEGITALVAAAILFYVGFWMHSRASAEKWSAYIKEQMNNALTKGALWSFAVVSFLAVYREIFETILFYQALWAQVDAGAHNAVVGGAGVAIVLLAVIMLLIYRFGMRLPLGQFFTLTAYLMIALAFIFAGKGVAAMQEAGRIPLTAVDFPRIELLGIYPNLQGLLLQAAVLVLAVILLLRQKRKAA